MLKCVFFQRWLAQTNVVLQALDVEVFSLVSLVTDEISIKVEVFDEELSHISDDGLVEYIRPQCPTNFLTPLLHSLAVG